MLRVLVLGLSCSAARTSLSARRFFILHVVNSLVGRSLSSSEHYNTTQYNTTHYNTTQHNMIQHNTDQRNATQPLVKTVHKPERGKYLSDPNQTHLLANIHTLLFYTRLSPTHRKTDRQTHTHTHTQLLISATRTNYSTASSLY
jgi:hypothetical protein